MVANGGEHIEHLAVGFCRIANAVGGDDRQTQRGGERKQRLVAALLVAAAVALQFEIEMRGAVDGCEPVDDFARGMRCRSAQGRGERAFVAAGETDQASGKLFEIFERGCAFGLGGFAHLEARDELAEILIAGLRCAEQEQARRLCRMLMRQPGRRREHVAEGAHGNLRADVRAHAAAHARGVKARRAVEAVAVGKREGRHAELRRRVS